MQTKFSDRDGFIWMDGELVNWRDCKIHVLSHGLHYASSAFEGIRIYNNKAFKLKEHIERLFHSAKVLNIKIKYELTDLIKACEIVIANNDIKEGYIRPITWRGTDTMLISGGSEDGHVAIAAWEVFEDKRREMRERGSKLIISSWKKPNPDSSPYTTKASCIYTLATIAKNEASAQGVDDAIMLSSDGYLTEATTANLFLIKNNEIHTPIPDCFLDGITRQTIIELAKNRGISVHERRISQDELSDFDAAFLTGTAIEIMPIKSISNFEFDISHPLIHDLTKDYSELVRANVD